MLPMFRLLSTVTVRTAVSVNPNVAVSGLVVVEFDPGTPAVQLPEVVQLPFALTFHDESAANAEEENARVAATAITEERDLIIFMGMLSVLMAINIVVI